MGNLGPHCLQQTCKQRSGHLTVVIPTGKGSKQHIEGREAQVSVALAMVHRTEEGREERGKTKGLHKSQFITLVAEYSSEGLKRRN